MRLQLDAIVRVPVQLRHLEGCGLHDLNGVAGVLQLRPGAGHLEAL